ncbi:MAG TPA: IS1634 family transposase [Actinomycetes bacterium]|nr:IS1634 family transposase [Actinomycetes bacterium]
MYVKRYVVRRGATQYVYLRLVEAYRDQHGQVRHRVLHTLGREDQLKQSGQLDQLAAALHRLDPPMAGTRRDVGPLLLVACYLNRLGLASIVDQQLPQRGRAQLTHGEVVAALVANRLAAPSPLYDIAGWASSAAMTEVFKIPGALLNDDRLGRTLDALAPVTEQIRGTLMLAAIQRFGVDAARLHLDLTTLRVAGAYEGSALVRKGWGPDRRVARQVRLLQATNPAGIPLYVRPDPGDTAELVCIGAALERLAQLLPPGLLVCADSALGHVKNLCAADRAGLRFVVPLRDASGFAERFLVEVGHAGLHRLDYVADRQRHLPTSQQTRYRGVLRPFAVTDPDTGQPTTFRVAYIWSSEEANSVADGRERALVKAEQALGKVQRGLGGRYYKTRTQVDAKVAQLLGPAVRGLLQVTTGTRAGKPTLGVARDQAAITAAARTDGVYALATNLPGRLSATQVLRIYKDQPLVELRHRDAKQTLRVRPIFLHNDQRITALVSIVGLALVIFGLIQADLRHALGPDQQLDGLLPEGRAARPTGRNILAAFQGLGLTYTPDGIVLDRLTSTQRRILQLLKIPLPWPEQAT